MSTIAKAMELLDFFSLERPEIGLSDFHRLAGRDKATTFRHLTALESAGLLEQNPTTRAYRIGPAVLRLAHMREITLPRRAGLRIALPRLAEVTGETGHAFVFWRRRGHFLNEVVFVRYVNRKLYAGNNHGCLLIG